MVEFDKRPQGAQKVVAQRRRLRTGEWLRIVLMQEQRMIDLYCERLGPGLWAEPINAFTNLSFVVAAVAILLQAKRRDVLSFEVWLLVGLIAAIGVGSGLFHTFANHVTRVLDIVPILLLQIAFLWIYGRRLTSLSVAQLAALVAIFFIAAYFGRQFPHVLNGSLIYGPAVALLLGLAIYHYRHANKQPTMLLWATMVFGASLFFRSIDMVMCPHIPIGTHFLWHILNGLTVYLAIGSLVANTPTMGSSTGSGHYD